MFSGLGLAPLVLIFLTAAAAVWVAGIRLSSSTDALDTRLGLGEALGGAILLAIATIGSSQAPKGTPGQTKRYLYISTPDAAQDIYKAGLPGILVFDMDDGCDKAK